MATIEPESPGELDFSDPSGDDFESLARDRLPIRSMAAGDLALIVEIDRRLTGRLRQEYYQRLMDQVMGRTGVRVSLATVYNCLRQFTDAGLLREVVVDASRLYFDTNVGQHHHFFDHSFP